MNECRLLNVDCLMSIDESRSLKVERTSRDECRLLKVKLKSADDHKCRVDQTLIIEDQLYNLITKK